MGEVDDSFQIYLQNFFQHIFIMKNISISRKDSKNVSIEDLADKIFPEKSQPSKDYLDEITSNEIVSRQIISSHSPQSEGLQPQAKFLSLIYTIEGMDAFLKFDIQSSLNAHILGIPQELPFNASILNLSSQKLPMKKVQAENLIRKLPSLHEGSDKNKSLKDSPPLSSVQTPTVASVQHLQSSPRTRTGIKNYAENIITILEHSSKQLVEFPRDKSMAVSETRVSGDGELKEGVGHRVDRWVAGQSRLTYGVAKPLRTLRK